MLGSMLQEYFSPFVNIHTAKKIEYIVKHIIKFGRSLTNFVIGNHMNTLNELNSVRETF